MSSNRSKIPRDRDVEGDSMLSARTPRAAEDPDRNDSGSTTVGGQQRGSPKRDRTRSSGPRRHDDAYNHHYPVPPHSAAPSSGQPWIHSHFLHPPTTGHSHPPSTNAHGRNHRRHGSVDSLPVNAPAQRRAFAAWGRDESDSNASDSDA
ncbi:hypothetical protein DL93DRAFT_2166140 [Clavulina sp. PMI_390]|nr:hypothetical protein DL93DRAFT_2166140 [Clavulina sp. PMI_390]